MPGGDLARSCFSLQFTPDQGLAPSTWGTELLLVASSNIVEMLLPHEGDGQRGQAETQNITWYFGEQESGVAFPQASTVSPGTRCFM